MSFILPIIFWGFVSPFCSLVDTGTNTKFDYKLPITKLTCKQKIRFFFPTQDLIQADKNKYKNPEEEMAQKLFFGVMETFVKIVMGKFLKQNKLY